jgi:hypothetical protein
LCRSYHELDNFLYGTLKPHVAQEVGTTDGGISMSKEAIAVATMRQRVANLSGAELFMWQCWLEESIQMFPTAPTPWLRRSVADAAAAVCRC